MNIRDALAYLGVQFWEGGQHRHVTPGYVGIDCPLCSPSSGKAKLGIRLTDLFTKCWTCQYQRLGQILSLITGRSVGEILRLLPLRESDAPPPAIRPTGIYKEPPGVRPMLPAHTDYLAGRGIDPDYAAGVWGVRGIGHDGGDLRWRLFIPAFLGGKPVSWTTRAVGNDPRRYRAASVDQEAVPMKSLLFGEQFCTHAAVVVEGPLCAIKCGPGFVATGGTSWTSAQMARIAKYAVRVICFDSEAPAQDSARKLVRHLEVESGETYLVRCSAKALDEAPPNELEEIKRRFLT